MTSDAGPGAGLLVGLAAGLLGTVIVLAGVLLRVARPLERTMVELGGAEHRGRFWATLGSAALTAGTFLAALAGFWWHAAAPAGTLLTSAGREPAAVWTAIDVLRWALAALTFGMGALAAMVLTSTATSPNTRRGRRSD